MYNHWSFLVPWLLQSNLLYNFTNHFNVAIWQIHDHIFIFILSDLIINIFIAQYFFIPILSMKWCKMKYSYIIFFCIFLMLKNGMIALYLLFWWWSAWMFKICWLWQLNDPDYSLAQLVDRLHIFTHNLCLCTRCVLVHLNWKLVHNKFIIQYLYVHVLYFLTIHVQNISNVIKF